MVVVTSITSYKVSPQGNRSQIFATYTKANAGDTIDLSAYGLQSIDGVFAMSASGATQDPATWSATTVTLSAGTGVGFLVAFGMGIA
jgi:hypothetical protein